MDQFHMRDGGEARASRGAAMGARKRLPLGRKNVHERGGGRALRGASVVARKRLRVGRIESL